MLAAAAGPGPAFVVPTAAARQGPEDAVAHATSWFARLGLPLHELPVLKRTDANSKDLAAEARKGGFFYLVGGDPGLVAQVLRESRVWTSIFEAWRDGAALAGSSAGAMALCSHTLIRAGWPDRTNRRPNDGLGVVPDTAVLPHYDTFGHKWVESARRELPDMHGGRGPAVVFVHGLGSSGYMEWRHTLESTAARHRVFAPDLPGYGRSDKPRARYTIPYFARFISRYMEERGLRAAALVGTSLGGRIALEVALERPKLVRKLVLINTLGLGRPQVRMAQMAYGLVTIPRVGEAVMRLTRDALSWAPAAMIRRVAGRYA